MRYYIGETINITIESEDFNFDEIDFSVWLYKHTDNPIVVNKSEMTVLGDGRYMLTLASDITEEMELGRYTMEIVCVDDNVVILKALAFELVNCVSKGNISYGGN